jgi:hypothetical protein
MESPHKRLPIGGFQAGPVLGRAVKDLVHQPMAVAWAERTGSFARDVTAVPVFGQTLSGEAVLRWHEVPFVILAKQR